ncbi:MAG: DNA replication/repair protein RecF [Actinobacteria bacterium]|nr:DNA replication/repair protein RecF [Actinomycetota bacterium]
MIRRIYLENFRNYPEKQVELKPGINLIIGENGTGKTNLLEAVFVLLEGRSPRTADLKEVVRTGEESALVRGWVGEGGEERGETRVEREGEVRRREARGFDAVAYMPDDIYLVKGGPEERRRYLDETVGLVKKGYRELSREYARILKQRNEAIRMVRREVWGRERIRHWNTLLLERGEEITRERMGMAERATRAMKIFASGWGVGEIRTRYYSNMLTTGGEHGGEEKGVGGNEEKLRMLEEAEIRRGMTLLGPHRDELFFTYNGESARSRCSQGEQKILSLLLRLAQADIIEEYSGRRPVLLLDDCFSELDARNREALLTLLEGWGQVIVTSTDDVAADAVSERIYL